MTFEQKILARIKTEHLRPVSRKYFQVRDYALWGLMGAFVAALGLGFGMIIHGIMSTDLSVLAKLELSSFEKVVFSFPIFWIIACAVIATVAFINLRNTKKGYRVSGRQFIIISALVSVGVGSIVYALNVTQYLSRVAADNIPLYDNVVAPNTSTWLDPQRGLLSGTVRSKESDREFTVRDANAVLWYVTGEDIYVPEGFVVQTGERVKIIGKAGKSDTFVAKEVQPWID